MRPRRGGSTDLVWPTRTPEQPQGSPARALTLTLTLTLTSHLSPFPLTLTLTPTLTLTLTLTRTRTPTLTLTLTLTLTFTLTLTSTLTRLARNVSPTLKDSPNNSFNGGSFNQGTGSFHPPPAFVAKPPRVSIFRSGKSDLSQGAPVQVVEWSALVGQRFLGSGEFCSVWGAELDGKRVAVKVPRSSG